jgi:hypothetical protein
MVFTQGQVVQSRRLRRIRRAAHRASRALGEPMSSRVQMVHTGGSREQMNASKAGAFRRAAGTSTSLDGRVDVVQLPFSDPRGPRALRARVSFRKGGVICEYGGLISLSGDRAAGGDLDPAYSVGLQAVPDGTSLAPGEGLCIDAYGKYESVGSMANDYAGYARTYNLRSHAHAQNAEFVEVTIDGWPHMFLVALRDIAIGEEILVSYGDAYWGR